MSILNAIKHDLGIVEGILIPGASANTTATTHAVQQVVADAYGKAITKAVNDLAPNTDMTGPQKAQTIAGAVASDMIAKGFKAEFRALRDVVVDVVQAAYRAAEPNIGTAIIALATALHAGPALVEVAELAAPLIQKAADQALGATHMAVAA